MIKYLLVVLLLFTGCKDVTTRTTGFLIGKVTQVSSRSDSKGVVLWVKEGANVTRMSDDNREYKETISLYLNQFVTLEWECSHVYHGFSNNEDTCTIPSISVLDE